MKTLLDIIKSNPTIQENRTRFEKMQESEARDFIRGICKHLTETAPDSPEYDTREYKLWNKAVSVQCQYIGMFKDKFGVQY